MRQKRALGENHQDTLASLNQLGVALDIQAKYTKAEDVYRDAWKGRKETLGADHEDTPSALHSLGEAITKPNTPKPKPSTETPGSVESELFRKPTKTRSYLSIS